jgi:hypothetical protein
VKRKLVTLELHQNGEDALRFLRRQAARRQGAARGLGVAGGLAPDGGCFALYLPRNRNEGFAMLIDQEKNAQCNKAGVQKKEANVHCYRKRYQHNAPT